MSDYLTKSKRIKQVLLGVTVITLVTIVIIFSFHRNSTSEVEQTPSKEVTSDTQINIGKVHETAMRDGAVEWVLNAISANYDAAKNELVIDRPQVVFHLKNDKNVVLSASQGTYNKGSQDIALKGDVKALYENINFETESLLYQYAKGSGKTQTPVKIYNQSAEITADQMVYVHDESKVFFNGNVKGIFYEDEQ